MAEDQTEGGAPIEPTKSEKKGIGTLAWVAIGCGVLILIAFVFMSAGTWFAAKKIKEVSGDFQENPAKAAAELMVKMNPDLELVESDEDEGTITVRQKSSGETATFDYSQIQEGKLAFEAGGEEFSVDVTGDEDAGVFTLKTDEGEARIGAFASEELPEWIPLYPGASEPKSTYAASTAETVSGLVSIRTSDDVDAVLEFYRSELEAAGYEVEVSTLSGGGGGQAGAVNGRNQETGSTVNATASRDGEETLITIQYNGRP